MASIARRDHASLNSTEVNDQQFINIDRLNIKANSHESDLSAHFVQFYESDAFLEDAVSSFLGAGLGTGSACIMIAMPDHRAGIERLLESNGLDLDAARARNRYISLDAEEALARFMIDGQPDPEQFFAMLGGLMAQVSESQKPLRIFGEMVAVLWNEGKQRAALRLESLWNELSSISSHFLLFCAYPMQSFVGEEYEEFFAQVCHEHAQVIPTESFTALADSEERLRAVSTLQQKAASLHTEVIERKVAEERLWVSENRYRRLFEASIDGILMVDPETGVINDVNPSLVALLGTTREQILGQELWQIGLLPDQETQREFLQQMREQRTARTEAVLQCEQEEQTRFVECVSTVFRANGHDILQCNVRDATERHQAEMELKELEKQREAFIGLVTHELKNPLTALQGNVQLAHRQLGRLLNRLGPLASADQQMLDDILLMLSRSQQQLRIEHRLINDLLDISHIQEDKLELHMSVGDLLGLVYRTVQDYQTAHLSRLIELELPEQDTFPVYADHDRLQQVLSNYLTNALKFSPASEPVEVGVSLKGEIARVWVKDHGPGLSRKQQESIWQRSYQAPRTPVQSGWKEGLGLGLYICHQLMQRQQGQVGVESVSGQGATFWFELPVAKEPEES